MLTLIRREIADNPLYVVFVGIVVASAIWISVYGMLWAQEPEMLGMAAGLFVPALLFGYFGLGPTQMYGDRAHKVSSLRCTLGVTRNRIFAARVAAGAATVLATVIPLAVTATILLQLFPNLATHRGRIVGEVAVTVVLPGIVCHVMGLLAGWTCLASIHRSGCLYTIGP